MKKTLLLCTLMAASFFVSAQNYWREITSGTQKNLLSVSFGNAQTGYIGGEDSLLLKSTNGGQSWQPVATSGFIFNATHKDIIHVNFLNDSTGYAITGNHAHPVYTGELYKTTDGGNHWSPIASGNIAGSTTFFFDELNGFEAGSAFFAGYTITRCTGGVWDQYHYFNYDPYDFLYAIDFYNTQYGITGGSRGYIYRTFDAGVSWDTVKTNTDSAIRGIQFISDKVLLAATEDDGKGMILSTDSGKSWQLEPTTLTFSYPQLTSLTRSPRDSFIAVGRLTQSHGGILLYWYGSFAANQTVAQPLNSVAMADQNIGFAVGDSGMIVSNREVVLGVASFQTEKELKVFPNPGKGELHTVAHQPHCLFVYDLAGKLLWCDKNFSTTHHVRLSLPDGCYVLEATDAQGHRQHQKIIISRAQQQ